MTVSAFAAPSTITLMVSSSTVQASSSTMLTATVAGTSTIAAPTGTVSFFDGTTMIGSAAVGAAASGTTVSATLSTVLTGLGAHSLSAKYAGDSNDAASTSLPTTVTVATIPTVTTLSLASASIAVGAGDVLTATVTSGAGVPGGTVTFFNGTTSIGIGTLANGVATLTNTSGTVESEMLAATYNATGNYAGSSSAALMLSVTNPVTLTLSAYAVSIAPGASGTVTIAASPALGFTGPVTFTCTSPVAYVTCSLNPASQTISGTTAVQSTVALNVAATVSQVKPAPTAASRTTVYAFLFPLGAFALLGFARQRRNFSRLSLVIVLSLCVEAVLGIAGCGASTAPTPVTKPPAAPSGTQVVSPTAKSATVTQTIQLTVNIGN